MTGRSWLIPVLFVLAACGCLAGAASGQGADKKMREIAVRELTAAEDRLKKTERLAQQRTADEKDLILARYQVLDARYQLAQLDQEPQKKQIDLMRQMVRVYHDYYILMGKLEGKGRVARVDVDGARLGLAEAQIRLETHVIIDIYERQVERLQKLLAQKAATANQLEDARKMLESARRRLADLPR